VDLIRRFEHHLPERRVGRRDMVEAVDLLDLLAQRAAHDQPHHQLDAFRTRFAQIFDVRHVAQALGFAIRSSMNAMSNSLLIRPARGPWSWWLMPPVPQTWTFRSSSKLSTARLIASPSEQRLPDGGG
jgi:hypothetical protein